MTFGKIKSTSAKQQKETNNISSKKTYFALIEKSIVMLFQLTLESLCFGN